MQSIRINTHPSFSKVFDAKEGHTYTYTNAEDEGGESTADQAPVTDPAQPKDASARFLIWLIPVCIIALLGIALAVLLVQSKKKEARKNRFFVDE